jgi:hypothetical protein
LFFITRPFGSGKVGSDDIVSIIEGCLGVFVIGFAFTIYFQYFLLISGYEKEKTDNPAMPQDVEDSNKEV